MATFSKAFFFTVCFNGRIFYFGMGSCYFLFKNKRSTGDTFLMAVSGNGTCWFKIYYPIPGKMFSGRNYSCFKNRFTVFAKMDFRSLILACCRNRNYPSTGNMFKNRDCLRLEFFSAIGANQHFFSFRKTCGTDNGFPFVRFFMDMSFLTYFILYKQISKSFRCSGYNNSTCRCNNGAHLQSFGRFCDQRNPFSASFRRSKSLFVLIIGILFFFFLKSAAEFFVIFVRMKKSFVKFLSFFKERKFFVSNKFVGSFCVLIFKAIGSEFVFIGHFYHHQPL